MSVFRLYISLKDVVVFESELLNKNINFHIDTEKDTSINREVKYYFSCSDQESVDQIIQDKGIIASTDLHFISDYRDQEKLYKIYIIILVVVILTVLGVVVLDL
ncbi:hypothetical protein [Mesonia sp. K7]|uniref:hypothetical protein n=1 Tax=Mesonia sp. K7 TaxID=2218606 RepID=UPI000DA97F25|nr:hypothetical protein [Mesonia sp. K7]PZD77037.1 hypothetical protein DNG35_10370 [Mesonia sp. K7]